MAAACSEACGHCGACTAPWERESEDAEVCPGCLGRGEVVRCDGSDWEVVAVCSECDGKGWIE